jgi:hypothetical protein
LHLAPGVGGEQRIRYRLRAPRPDDAVGAMGAVVTGKLGVFILALFLGAFVLEFFSMTLWYIDFFLLFAVVFGVIFRSRVRPKPRSTQG